MGKSKLIIALAWLLIPATIASAHPPHVEPYKFTIAFAAAAVIAISAAVAYINAYPKKWFIGIALGLSLFVACAFVGNIAAFILSM